MDLSNSKTQEIINKISKLSRLEERIASMPIEAQWLRDIQDRTILFSSINSYILDGGEHKPTSEVDIDLLPNNINKYRLLNEIELRRSFPVYFKGDKLEVELFTYLHRFLDNVYDEESKSRGKYRKGQKVHEEEQIGTNELFPRYGFIPRLLGEFVSEINDSQVNYYILAAIAHLRFAKIAPFERGNFQIARLVGEGVLFNKKKGQGKQTLDNNQLFARHPRVYLKMLKQGMEGNEDEWVNYYLDSAIVAMKEYARNIERFSGGALKPLSNQVIPLTKRQKSIVDLLRKNGQMSGSEIAEILGVTRQNIFIIMQKLLDKKVVGKVGRGSTSRYRLLVK